MQPRWTPAVKALTLVTLAVFILQKVADQFLGANVLGILGLVPSAVMNGAVWQLLTYVFLHGDVSHLILNLLMLVFIGSELEAVWGRRRFLIFYFFCSFIAAVTYLLLQVLVWQANVPMVGASGGIYGLLLAYGLLFGDRVLLFMMLFPMKARHFVWVLAGVEFLTGLFSGASGGALSSVAHLGGMAGGWIYLYARGTWLMLQKRRGTPASRSVAGKRKSSHLKLVTDRDTDRDSDDSGPKTWH